MRTGKKLEILDGGEPYYQFDLTNMYNKIGKIYVRNFFQDHLIGQLNQQMIRSIFGNIRMLQWRRFYENR